MTTESVPDFKKKATAEIPSTSLNKSSCGVPRARHGRVFLGDSTTHDSYKLKGSTCHVVAAGASMLLDPLKVLLTFVKFRVVMLSTLSAVTGFVLVLPRFSFSLVLFAFGLFLLAGGSAGLNQVQERRFDALMERTGDRPLVIGVIAPVTGLVIALGFVLGGSIILYMGFGVWPALLGLVTAFLYNGVYTYLKRVTAFAAIPGALVGALPPAIGWTAAGGDVLSPTLMGLVLFFYLWQVPHFWLLVGRYHDDYTRAGFPSMTDRFSQRQLARLTFTWTTATACAALLFPVLRMFNHEISLVVLTVLVLWLAFRSVSLVSGKTVECEPVFRRAFFNINIFALLIMVTLIVDNGV